MLTPRFRLFNRKDDFSKAESEESDPRLPLKMSISNGLSILHDLDIQNTQEICSKLSLIRLNVVRSLKNIEKLATELETEKIKIEETRFEPIVENSKRIVVTSLRRECSVEIPQPISQSEAIRFDQRLEAITSRFREVSTSHNRVFNVFIKKYAGKLKDEFETLSSQSKEVKAILTEFDTIQKPYADCTSLLKSLSDANISLTTEQQQLKKNSTELKLLENRLGELNLQMDNIQKSLEFQEYARIKNEISKVEDERAEIQKELIHLISPISRALTKYSYGISKQTSERLDAFSNKPWVVLSEIQIDPYLDILIDIQRHLDTERLQLKDAPRVARHLDNVIRTLPNKRETYQALQRQLHLLNQQRNTEFDKRSLGLKEQIAQTSRVIEEMTTETSQLGNQLNEKQLQVDQLRRESEACLSKIFGKKYNLEI
jgi:DNA repair exonuclease SbcCD ATPase subunit